MKKKQVKIESLLLDKETISKLNSRQLDNIAGGQAPPTISCNNQAEEDEGVTQSCCYTSCNTVECAQTNE